MLPFINQQFELESVIHVSSTKSRYDLWPTMKYPTSNNESILAKKVPKEKLLLMYRQAAIYKGIGYTRDRKKV